MAGKVNPSLIGPRTKNRGFYSQSHYDARYRDKSPRILTAAELERHRAYNQTWPRTAESVFAHRVQRFNLLVPFTWTDFKAMLEAQHGCCKICGRAFSDALKPQVDHCHKERRVRSLLCHGCNAGLGLFRESQDALAAAILYLQEHHAERFLCASV